MPGVTIGEFIFGAGAIACACFAIVYCMLCVLQRDRHRRPWASSRGDDLEVALILGAMAAIFAAALVMALG